jgi:hypothetical protein
MLALYDVALNVLGVSGYDQSINGEWKRMSDAITKTRLKAKIKVEMAHNYGRLYNLIIKANKMHYFSNLFW